MASIGMEPGGPRRVLFVAADGKREISEDEWQRAAELGADFMRRYPGKAPNGSPPRCHVPCVFKIF